MLPVGHGKKRSVTGVIGDIEHQSAEIGVRAERDALEVGRELDFKGVNAFVVYFQAACKCLGVCVIQSPIAGGVIFRFTQSEIKWGNLCHGHRDLDTG